MTEKNTEPNPSSTLPPAVVEAIDHLDEAELRAVIDYAQQRYEVIHPDVSEQIEPGPGEEIVRIEEKPTYTLVVKRQPCGKDCDDCPHGPFLYHVREEPQLEGGTKLRWRYLGMPADS
ncbi:hypothetical protein RH858_10580 [Halalkaliarchaeum sp. AArc-GB]|uniref:hypothetical protein n=1 Tax=Halalkaliarchaeum sp. AArc-GB TaxID=3074078 RepID=UPI0028622040|nr:hypothetical protein [Halalkaliarchaeum sp. AArc-GB]MDR5673583.1 hypothetical protein [Halalkaliarchaeum sp. AArc-GB]